MRKRYIVIPIAIITSSLLMTACGNKSETVSAMSNNVLTETSSSSHETETQAQTQMQDNTETQTQSETESTTEIETQTEDTTETQTQDTAETSSQIKSTEEQAKDLVEERYKHEVSTSATSFTTSPMTKTMYATTDAYTYEGPDIEGYEIKAAVQEGEEVRIIGKVNEANWYKIEQEGNITSYISADLLTPTDPNPTPAPAPSTPATNSTPQTAQNTQPQQTPTTQPQQTQTPQQTTPPADTGEHISSSQIINPATGDYYKPGDVFPDGSIYAGDFNTDDWW